MPNPFDEFRKEIAGALVIILLVIVAVFIYETLKTMPGSTPQTQAIADQGEQTTIWAALLWLGLPSTAVIGIIIYIIKKIKESNQNISI